MTDAHMDTTADHAAGDATRRQLAEALCETAQLFAQRGWTLGGGGCFSVALRRQTPRLLLTADGRDKLTLTPDDCQLVECDQAQAVTACPQAMLHALLVRHAPCGAVIQTQSPASLALSDVHAMHTGLTLEAYDLLRHLGGGRASAERHWLAILEYQPRERALERQLVAQLTDPRQPARHALLLRRGGLVAWGDDLAQARRHAEIFETILAAMVCRAALPPARHA